MVLVLPRRRQCAARGRAVLSRTRRASAPSIAPSPGSSERLNGEDGLGAIFPAMANSVMMFDVLGYPEDHPQRAIARKSIEKLLVVHDDEAYCQPCVSPIWDTGLACHALLEVGGERTARQVKRGLDWLVPMQVLDVRGDWIARRPDLRPGGWAFQYANPHYPDVDDTAVVAMAMDRVQKLSRPRGLSRRALRARANGSSACRARTAAGARSTPTTNIIISTIFRSPITARCSIRRPRTSPRAACRCWRNSARRRQQRGGRARRRLSAPDAARRRQLVRPLGHELHLRHLVGAVRAQRRRRRLTTRRRCARRRIGSPPSRTTTAAGARTAQATSSTTAATSGAVDRVTDRLGAARPDGGRRGRSSGGRARHRISRRQRKAPTASGTKPRYTATGFPRVFYLRYHGYAKFFPLWALARYRNLKSGNTRAVAWGM